MVQTKTGPEPSYKTLSTKISTRKGGKINLPSFFTFILTAVNSDVKIRMYQKTNKKRGCSNEIRSYGKIRQCW